MADREIFLLEQCAFVRLLPFLRFWQDKWGLFKGDALVSICDSHDEAVVEGDRRFGPGNYLAKQLCPEVPSRVRYAAFGDEMWQHTGGPSQRDGHGSRSRSTLVRRLLERIGLLT